MRSSFTRSTKSRCGSLVVIALSAASPAYANTVVTSASDSGPGSLREAIANASAGDVISFNLPAPATIMLGSTLTVDKSVTISGPGDANLSISGNHAVGVFAIDPGTNVTISGVKIENGTNSGIENQGTLNIVSSTISGNSAVNGGGISNWNGGAVTITNSTLSGNSGSSAGGIFNWNNGSLTIIGSTFSGNSAGSWGGGISSWGTLTIVNSTFAGNNAGNGGGVFAYAGTTTVINSTFSGNTASTGGGGNIWNQSDVTLKNTILANGASGGNCGGSGAALSKGHNLSDDTSCSSFLLQTGDLNNTGAGLDPAGLQDNGGHTKTIALVSSSVAQDAIPTVDCTLADGTTPVGSDQRGTSRPQGPACDIGSVETAQPSGYQICLLYDTAKAVKSGGTIPIKFELCDGSGQDVSSASIIVHAVSVTQSTTSVPGLVQDAGNANPDQDFRFNATLGGSGGYIFNLSTKGYAIGTYNLHLTVTGSTADYSVPFQVK